MSLLADWVWSMPSKGHISPPWPARVVSPLVRADPRRPHYLPAEAGWRPEWTSAARPGPPAGDLRIRTSPQSAGPGPPGKPRGILGRGTIESCQECYNQLTCRCHVLSGQHPCHTRRHPRHQLVPLGRVDAHLTRGRRAAQAKAAAAG